MNKLPERDDRMLTAQELSFITAYMEGHSTKVAKELAGLPAGSNVKKRPHVRAVLAEEMGERLGKAGITAERVLKELSRLALANLDDFLEDDYTLKPMKPKRSIMATVQTVKIKTRAPEGDEAAVISKEVEVKQYNKMDALNSLARHFGLFNDKIEITGDLAERLARARSRLGDDTDEAPQTHE